MQHARTDDETWRECRDELRRAYLLVSFGNVDAGIEICREVDDRLGGAHHLPATLEGEFLVAKGELREAIGRLRETIQRFPEQVLPRLHFAEACYLDGRTEQGERALEEARERHDGEHTELLESLEETWGDVDAEAIPPPVRIREAS